MNEPKSYVLTKFAPLFEAHNLRLESEQVDPDAFGNTLLVFSNQNLRLLLVRERGIWDIAISQPEPNATWYPLYLIRALIMEDRVLDNLVTLQDKYNFLEASFSKISAIFQRATREDLDSRFAELEGIWAKQWE